MLIRVQDERELKVNNSPGRERRGWSETEEVERWKVVLAAYPQALAVWQCYPAVGSVCT